MFRQSSDSVRALFAAGADPDHGRTAREVAAFFGLDEMATLLEG